MENKKENSCGSDENSKIIFSSYIKSYNDTGLQRLLSNYALIIINIVIILIQIELISQNDILYRIVILVIGIFFSLYLDDMIKDLFLIHETKFRVIMEFENKYSQISFFDNEWKRLTEEGKEESPVFVSKFDKYAYKLFIICHVSLFCFKVIKNI